MPSAKAAAPAKKAVKSAKKDKVQSPLFVSKAMNQRIGGSIRVQKDLSRFVRWPHNVRVQRQKKILLQRLKVPPTLMQFRNQMDRNEAAQLFKLLNKYQPETKAAKVARIEGMAKATASGENAKQGAAPNTLKFGLKHVTTLIEQKKCKLVVIAHDVDPIELVVWMPRLCTKMNIPYCIVRGKARLGALTHQKNCAVAALTSVSKEDEAALKTIADNCKTKFNDVVFRKWGGGVMGLKTQAKLEKRRQQIEIEEAKKAAAANK
jgi:large subunit ribosomal protein L7Ae